MDKRNEIDTVVEDLIPKSDVLINFVFHSMKSISRNISVQRIKLEIGQKTHEICVKNG